MAEPKDFDPLGEEIEAFRQYFKEHNPLLAFKKFGATNRAVVVWNNAADYAPNVLRKIEKETAEILHEKDQAVFDDPERDVIRTFLVHHLASSDGRLSPLDHRLFHVATDEYLRQFILAHSYSRPDLESKMPFLRKVARSMGEIALSDLESKATGSHYDPNFNIQTEIVPLVRSLNPDPQPA